MPLAPGGRSLVIRRDPWICRLEVGYGSTVWWSLQDSSNEQLQYQYMLDSQESWIFMHWIVISPSVSIATLLPPHPDETLLFRPRHQRICCRNTQPSSPESAMNIYMNMFHLRSWHLTTWPASCKIPSHHQIVISTQGRFRFAWIQSQIPQKDCYSVESSLCASLFVPSSHGSIPSRTLAKNTSLSAEKKKTDKPDKIHIL